MHIDMARAHAFGRMMTPDLFTRLHRRTFHLRKRPATEAEYLVRMCDMHLDDPVAALASFMAQRNANVRARNQPGATILTRKTHNGIPYWLP